MKFISQIPFFSRNYKINLIEKDNLLKPFEPIIRSRLYKIWKTEQKILKGSPSLLDFSSGHEYFGLHFRNGEWIFREWAPNATAIYLIGEMNQWEEQESFKLNKIRSDGVWEICLPSNLLTHGMLYKLRMHWHGGSGDRIPSYARRVVQDPNTLIFNAQVWNPSTPYQWKHPNFVCQPDPLLIYETHVGMAQEDEKIGTYSEFTKNIIPRIVSAGYTAIQVMAIQEHPYYGSFGYQVSNFFAASSRFGTPEDLKELIDTAHGYGLAVIMDIVHSHAVSNEVEGLSLFDGTNYIYFHQGARGYHPAWNSRCFDYAKIHTLHFLLSNCRFWLDEYRVDGFRFDGITSMIYTHHGLGKAFMSYEDYFNETVDEDALVYLALANKLIHSIRPDAITIAEDVSGMPGLATPTQDGGFGFDYRFAMGVPDYWIKLCKEVRDEDWHMGHLWFELTNRRKDEKTISYSESHDQALVGDQTLIFRLIGSDIYWHMEISDNSLRVDRGIALHKMIRLITLATAGHGYLNFMGNEFGHPEWIDFPREGNGWSYRFARRQWHLVDNPNLKYQFLWKFDKDMISLSKNYQLFHDSNVRLIFEHSIDKVIAFERAGLIFVFGFHPTSSHFDYQIEVLPGKYQMIFNSDASKYGGHNRLIPNQHHFTIFDNVDRHYLSLYIPTRTAIVLKRIE